MIPRFARLSGVGLRALPMFLVVLALGSVPESGVRCPAGMICAAPTFTGDEIAAMPEACFERIAADARRLRHRGFNAVIFLGALDSGNDVEHMVSPHVLARRLARAAALVRSASVAPLIRLEPRGGRALRLRRRPMVRSRLCESAGDLEPWWSATRESHVLRRTDRARGARASGLGRLLYAGVAAADRAGGRAGGRTARDLGGLHPPWSSHRHREHYGRGIRGSGRRGVGLDPQRGFRPRLGRLETAGRVARSRAASRVRTHATASRPPWLPGLRSRNVCRSRRARARAPAPPISRSASRPPPWIASCWSGSVGTACRTSSPGARASRRPCRQAARTTVIPCCRCGYPPLRPRRSSCVRSAWSSGRPPVSDRFAPRASLPCSRAEPQLRRRLRTTLALTGRARIALANVLAAARVTTGGETFARVVPQTLEAEDEPRRAIMAHPGSVRPTVVRWRLPAGDVPRHLSASVRLARRRVSRHE